MISIIYYTDCQLDPAIAKAARDLLLHGQQLRPRGIINIISVSLCPIDFGTNIVLNEERGPLAMFKQILAGIEESRDDIIFLAEHDVLYYPDYWDFVPERDDTFYYNQNLWKVDCTGRELPLFYYSNHTSQLCGARSLMLDHYKRRVGWVEVNGYSNKLGYEPGTHGRVPELKGRHDTWLAPCPNIDLRHSTNLSRTRWSKSEFRNQKFTAGWQRSNTIPCWGDFKELLHGLSV